MKGIYKKLKKDLEKSLKSEKQLFNLKGSYFSLRNAILVRETKDYQFFYEQPKEVVVLRFFRRNKKSGNIRIFTINGEYCYSTESVTAFICEKV